MPYPIRISYRNCDTSPAVSEIIEKRALNLERLFDRIVGCDIHVEEPHRHHRKGNLYRVRIELRVPGNDLVVGRNPDEHVSHADPYVAVHDAFLALERRLKEYVRCRRGNTKHHENGKKTTTPQSTELPSDYSWGAETNFDWDAVS